MKHLKPIFVLIIVLLFFGCSKVFHGYKRSALYSTRYLYSSKYEMADGVMAEDAFYRVADMDGSSYFDGIQSGTLTAGEINDFGKWELWTDIVKDELNRYQEDWNFIPLKRYSVQVINSINNPVINCTVELIDEKNNQIWISKTDNTGKAELWDNLYIKDTILKTRTIKVVYKNIVKTIADPKISPENTNIVKLDVDCELPIVADALFVVDATGSMADEIKYLQIELLDILNRVSTTFSNIELNTGSVFYRDNGDDYVTKVSDLNPDTSATINFIKDQRAGGGGDFPEAVDQALEVAMSEISWHDDARARLLFLILDAPPHREKDNIDKLQKSIQLAAAKGVKIIPITASGIDKSTEYLMRSFALATNGTYVFLTDHSGVGNPHIQPTTDQYDVELLNDLIYRLFLQNLTVVPCDKQDESIAEFDTVFVSNIIEHVVLDSLNQSDISQIDTNVIDQNIDEIDTFLTDEESGDSIDLGTEINIEPKSIKIYPNPTYGRLTIEVLGEIDELYLADISGKLLEQYSLNGDKRIDIDISKYPNGFYMIQFFNNEKWHSGKVILRH